MKKTQIWKLIICILICLSAGGIGSIFTSSSVGSWYLTINKPSFNPPSWVFGPVWTTLFILMGISLYLIIQKNFNKNNKPAVYIFILQLILNTIWSILFFGLKNPFYAFIEIILLWFAILANIFTFYKLSKTASYLLIPYILWVSFATFLNYNIWILN